MDIIKNPHDTFFKRTLSDKEVARSFLKNYLPSEILEEVNLNDLKIVKDSFVDKALKESYSDILFNVEINNRQGYIYILFEHKSYYDKILAVQLLAYMADIWELHNKQSKGNKLPLIIPILIYHGNKEWKYGLSLSAIMEDIPEGIDKYIPDYKYLLYDFSNYSDKEIKGIIKLKLFLTLISYKDLGKGLKEVLPLLIELKKQDTGMEYIETVVRYILSTDKEMSLKDLDKMVRNISLEGSEIIMTIAEKLREEGREEGEQRGERKILVETVTTLLEKKLCIEFSDDIIKKIEIAETEKLVKIRDNIFELKTMEEVRQILGI